VLCVVALIPFIPDLLFTRIHQAQTSGDIRTWIWSAGLRSWANHPFRGLGLDNFPVIVGPHSFLIANAVELGIVGLLLFFGAAGGQLWRARQTPSLLSKAFPTVSYEAACWSMMTAALFLDIIWRKFFWLNWLLLAIAVALNQRGRRREHFPRFGVE
jgi:O-antigen ligase